MDNCEVKIADFGLSALVRLDEDGYDAEESGKRKRYDHLKEVSEGVGIVRTVGSTTDVVVASIAVDVIM